MFSATEQAYNLEIEQAQQARRQQLWQQAWYHAERAHILGQQRFLLHLQSHWLMLKLATEQADWFEIRGQVLRLLLTPLGHLSGRLPVGNPGSSRYPVMQAQPVPEDLNSILSGTKQS
ncbi:DUF3703 domain-containing protein [Rheinheimera sediminis]|uniref:DUF3703 domain-containing protein n=1 Tax=Rheinheimera sp. YQF-1 TaxID=2499626 RepID=UPI000FD8DA03|nr:DUF3703 domain-containing protein [Rheinheimera sp. YQF-1]RVT46149.1 DUF3703 domain-containing protein [Rheinheimera sp. YQF-1]